MCTLTRYCIVLAASAQFFIVENTSPKASAFRFISPVDYDCGPAYLEIKAYNETGFISSPNHPQYYPSRVRCIWVLKAPLGCHVQLRVNYIRGQSTMTGTCIDYLEVHSRSNTTWRPVLNSCHLLNPSVIVSDERYLWLKFVSDQNNNGSEGFNAEWSVTCDGTMTTENVSVCSSVEYSCPNLECIQVRYRCDGRNDCGCTTAGCDEIDCRVLITDLSEAEKLGICLTAGILMFLLLYWGSKFLRMIHAKFQQHHSTGHYG